MQERILIEKRERLVHEISIIQQIIHKPKDPDQNRSHAIIFLHQITQFRNEWLGDLELMLLGGGNDP